MGRLTVGLDCCLALALALVMSLSRPSVALDPRFPDWPCQQLKVPEISIASVWSGPPIGAVDSSKPGDPREADLVPRLAARRTPIETAQQLIKDYLTGTAAERQQRATSLFAALYATLNAQRGQVMNGIERFSRKQKMMAEQIRANAQKIREIQDRPDADPAQNEALASELSWQTRIFDDRRKTTSYVCEVPVLIEKRLFDLSKAIQDALKAEPAK